MGHTRPLRILIVGAGAVGSYYGARWHQAGHDVVFVARGNTARALQTHGLSITSIAGDLTLEHVATVAEPPAEPFDLIVVAVKAYATQDIIDALSPAVSPKTWILSLQNGIGNEEQLAARYGPDQIAGGVAFIGVRRTAPGRIEHTASGWIAVGPWQADQSDRFAELFARLKCGEVDMHWSPDIVREIWQKLMWNAAFNTATCLTGTTAHALLAHPDGESLVADAMREVIAVAAAEGIELPKDAIGSFLTTTRQMGPVRTSMLVDREAGRPLELEAISGELVRRAAQQGLDVPIQRTLYALLKTVEHGGTQHEGAD